MMGNNTLTPETDDQPIIYAINDNGYQVPCVDIEFARKLERERDEAREALREIWQSGDAFLPYIDNEITNRWRKAAGWDEIK